MNPTRTLPVCIERDDDGLLIASVPGMPECFAVSRTLEDLLIRIEQVIAESLKHEPDFEFLEFVGLVHVPYPGWVNSAELVRVDSGESSPAPCQANPVEETPEALLSKAGQNQAKASLLADPVLADPERSTDTSEPKPPQSNLAAATHPSLTNDSRPLSAVGGQVFQEIQFVDMWAGGVARSPLQDADKSAAIHPAVSPCLDHEK
jgi:predicted RNase H-like HicB family nuclease